MKWTVEWVWAMNEDYMEEDQQVYFMREKLKWTQPSTNPSPNGVMKNLQYGTPTMKMQKRRFFIPDGSMKILTLTLAPMGMVALWRCQEHHRPSRPIH